jgi:hypothetical protein
MFLLPLYITQREANDALNGGRRGARIFMVISRRRLKGTIGGGGTRAF